MQLQDLVTVRMYYVDGSHVDRIIQYADVDRMVEAISKLHGIPGVNPHTGVKTKPVKCVSVFSMKFVGPFWWTTPDLESNYDPAGVKIFDACEIIARYPIKHEE